MAVAHAELERVAKAEAAAKVDKFAQTARAYVELELWPDGQAPTRRHHASDYVLPRSADAGSATNSFLRSLGWGLSEHSSETT